MEKYVATHWTMVDKPEIRETHSGVFLYTFKDEKQMNTVLEKAPRTFGSSHPFLLQRWRPGIKLDPRNVESTHLWITLPNLDYQFWSEDMLSRIASKVGKPVVTDKLTALTQKMSYPRILVEVSALQPLKEKVTLKGPQGEIHEQKVHFDWRPWQCNVCCRFGHKHGSCQAKGKV